jgi:ribonuclease HI
VYIISSLTSGYINIICIFKILSTQQVASHTLSMNSLHIWTDGSCINNGTSAASCGIGVFYSKDSARNVSASLPIGKQTNNRAELCAILYALCTNEGSQNITIFTDSNYSIKCITEYRHRWELNGWKTSHGRPVEWSSIIKYICILIDSRQAKGGTTKFEHIKGHSGQYGNEQADKLAFDAAMHNSTSNVIRFLERKCEVPFS